MLSTIMWRAHDLLHSKSATAFPGTLLAVAGVCLFHRHMTQEVHDVDTLKTFLILIILQMVPLIALEIRMFAANDPVSLLSKFGSKVLMMHVGFFVMRVCNSILYEPEVNWSNAAGLVGALIALHIGFNHRWSFNSLVGNRDVWCLLGLTIAFAIVTEQLDKYFRPNWWGNPISEMIGTAADYTEIVAFVPAVWTVYRMPKDASPVPLDKMAARRQAMSFFIFLITWYISEDVGGAFSIYSFLPLGAAAHILHFVLVVDFAGFLLAHLYDPAKLKADLMSWFPDGCVV